MEWIGSTGTQWINTNVQSVTSKLADYSADVVFSFPEEAPSSAGVIVGTYAVGGYYIERRSDGEIGFSRGYTLQLPANTILQGHVDWYSSSMTFTCDNMSTTYNRYNLNVQGYFGVFCNASTYGGSANKYRFIGKIYSAKIYYQGEIVFDGIPCYRKADNVIGMYDTVSGTFNTNAGTGTFTKGADV